MKPIDSFTIIFSGAFIVTGLALLIVAILQYRSAKVKSKTWLTCPGVVMNTSLEAHSSYESHGPSTTNYRPMVFYQYTVVGQTYTGSRIGFGNVNYDYGTASRKLRPYSPGAQVTVHYNPANPADAVLELKAQAGWILLLMGIVFMVVGIAAAIALPTMPK